MTESIEYQDIYRYGECDLCEKQAQLVLRVWKRGFIEEYCEGCKQLIQLERGI